MNWTTRHLADVADFCLGKMLDEKKNKGDALPYHANINVRWGEFDLDKLREMRFEHDEMERYGLKYGDIVMCEGGGARALRYLEGLNAGNDDPEGSSSNSSTRLS